jgi:exodeoxyribonuclease VII large subunit
MHIEMENMIKTVANMHPYNVLKRGYTITRLNGKAIGSVDQVKSSDILETILQDGSVLSTADTTKKSSGI